MGLHRRAGCDVRIINHGSKSQTGLVDPEHSLQLPSIFRSIVSMTGRIHFWKFPSAPAASDRCVNLVSNTTTSEQVSAAIGVDTETTPRRLSRRFATSKYLALF